MEAYAARSSGADVEAAAERATVAAADLRATGRAVRYVRTVFVPGDESCFYLFEADAAEDVADALRRAGIDCERIVEADVLK